MSLSDVQQQLLTVIAASQEPATQREAENEIKKYAASFGGYTLLLLSLLQPPAAAAVPPHLHQLIVILLKRHVATHWSESVDHFEEPVVPENEKAVLRAALLPLLAAPQRPVRRQVAALISDIAEKDFPERWDSLLPDILRVLQQAQSAPLNNDAAATNMLTGSMEVLVNFCEEMTDEQMTLAVPQLFPALLSLCSAKWTFVAQVQQGAAAASASGSAFELADAAQQAQLDDAVQFCIYALTVYQSCCSSLLTINDNVNDDAQRSHGKKQPRNQILVQLLQPTLAAWLTFITSTLTLPSGSATALHRLNLSVACPLLWALRLEACKAALCLVEKFDDYLLALGADGAAALQRLVELCVEDAVAAWPLYQRRVLNARIDHDDNEAAAGAAASADGEDDDDDESGEEDQYDLEGNAIGMSAFLFEAFALIKGVLVLPKPKAVKQEKKKAKNKTVATAAADPKQVAWASLKSFFQAALAPVLQVVVQYLQLSSAEIVASLSHVDDFLAFQEVEGEATGHGGAAVTASSGSAQRVNVRNGAKDLLLDCILVGGMSAQASEAREAEQISFLGMDGGDASLEERVGSALLERGAVVATLCPLLTGLLQQSASLRAAAPKSTPGAKHWWKGREVATMVLGYIVDDINVMQQQRASAKQSKKGAAAAAAAAAAAPTAQFDLQSFIRDVLIPDLTPASATAAQGLPPAPVLLRTQALQSTRHFAPVFERAKEGQLVALALHALVANMSAEANSLVVRIAAVQAFGQLCATLQNQSALTEGDVLVRALQSICQLVHSATVPPSAAAAGGPQHAAEKVDERALLEVLETLMTSLAVDVKTSISAEPTLTPLLIGAWSANATSPYVNDSIVDVMESLLRLSPAACTSVQLRVLPVLASILQAERGNVAVTGTVTAALDLLRHVLFSVEKHTLDLRKAAGVSPNGAGAASPPGSPSTAPSAAPELLHPLLFSELLPLTLALMLKSTTDSGIVHTGTQVLAAYLRIDSARVQSCVVPVVLPGAAAGSAPAPVGGLQLLCVLVNQCLNPALDDRDAYNVGTLVVQLVFSCGAALGENNIKELVKAVVARLHSSEYPPLTTSLLLVFARLIHSSSAASIVSFLASMGRIAVLQKQQVPVKKNASDKYASYLETKLVPADVEALPFLLAKWIEVQKEIHAAYPNKVLHSALVKLLTFLYAGDNSNAAASAADEQARAALRNLECKGYPIEDKKQSGRRVTRLQTAQQGASHEPQFSKVPLSTKLLSTFLNEWKEQREKQVLREKRAARAAARRNGEAGSDDDEDEDWEDEDDDADDGEFDESDEDDDDFIARMQAKTRGGGGAGAHKSPFAPAEDYPDLGASGGGKKLLQLSDMLDMGDADELDGELEDEVYPEAATDPLNNMELAPFLGDFISQFATFAQGAALRDAAQWLSPADKKLLDAALAAPAAAQKTPQKK